jgi:tetratricopeptide (TPR) repeat protein
MTSALLNKKSKIVVIDPSGPVRQLLADTLRQGLGFEAVEGKASISDALQFLEVETAAWVLVGAVQADQPANALHLLKICSEHPELKSVRVSFFVEPDEQYVLPPAFELGLFSWHPKPFTKDSLLEEMTKLLSRLEAERGIEPLVAGHYLRQHLQAKKSYAAQIGLEKGLLDLYPGNPQLLLNLAEPQFQSGQAAAAKKTLKQVKMVDASLADKVDEKAKALFGDASLVDSADSGDGSTDVLGVKTAVVIDGDDAVTQSEFDILKGLGVANVQRFADGEAAFEWLSKNPEPDLIVMEWRIRKLSGPLLVQRVRKHGFLNVPIIVLSSLLKPEDMPLVREIGIANIVQKPLNKDAFVPGLIFTMQQERLPTEQQALDRKIRALIRSRKMSEVEPLLAKLTADPQVPTARKRAIEAEYLYVTGDYPKARDAGVEALKLSGDSILVLNVLGKTFMRLKNHEAALKCFNKAQEMSPNNIERLCNMAESQTELGQHDAASDTLEDAKTLDPDSATVAEARIKVAITKGDTGAAKKLMGALDSLDSLVSYMNNKAVAYAKCGHTNDAIELYKKTVSSIPDDKTDTKAIVTYNLALAQVRESAFEEAVVLLKQVLAFPPSRVHKKSTSLMERLKVAMEKGAEFKLKQADMDGAKAPSPDAAKDAAPKEVSVEDRPAIAAVEARRGEICCFLVYHHPEAADPRATALLAKPPRFQRRQAIARSEALGVEKVQKESA